MSADAAPRPRLALVGLAYDENSSFLRGAAEAPPRIRAALGSDASNAWTESGVELSPGTFFDAGDVGPEPGTDMLSRVENEIAGLLERGLAPIALGGDHAVTFPVLRAFAKKFPKLSILHFDAHPDIYDVFEGNRLSHACPFARIMEEGLAARLVQVGIRTATAHQREQIARFRVESIEMKDFERALALEFDGPVYVTFDVDGLDPAFAPGVSHPEPGGFSTRQALDVIARVRAPIVGADVVEYNPGRDPAGSTAVVCAKLVKELAGRMLVHGA